MVWFQPSVLKEIKIGSWYNPDVKKRQLRAMVCEYRYVCHLMNSIIIIILRMVNYDGLKKQTKHGRDHWEKYNPTSIENLLIGTTWIFFYRHFIGVREKNLRLHCTWQFTNHFVLRPLFPSDLISHYWQFRSFTVWKVIQMSQSLEVHVYDS